jgi:hypothetical protein
MSGAGVLDGSEVRVNMQYEEAGNYLTLDGTRSPFVPGSSGTLETAEATNNIVRITNFSKEVAVALKESNFDGAWSLSFGLTNPWWLESIYGSPSTTDNADGSYTHDYSLANGDARSFQIFEGYETSTKAERELQGCVTGRVAIEPSVTEDGETRVTMEGFYATEETNTGVTLTSQDGIDDDVLDYGDAALKRDGSTEALVQDATLELAWETAEVIRAFGSRVGVDFLLGLFTPSLDHSKIKQDADTLQDVYGGASATVVQESMDNSVSAELSFDNGVSAGSGINKHVYSLTSTLPNSYGEEGVGDANTALAESLNRPSTDAAASVTNETQSPP